MKTFLTIILGISFLCMSCESSSINMRIENKTGYEIRGIKIYVQGVEYKIEKIEALGKQNLKVPLNAIELNNHDFRIEASYINKEGKTVNGFDYNDLSGAPNPEYIITLNSEKISIK